MIGKPASGTLPPLRVNEIQAAGGRNVHFMNTKVKRQIPTAPAFFDFPFKP